VPNHKIETANRTFAYLRNLDVDVLPVQGTQEIYLLNSTDSEQIQLKVQPPVATAYSAQILDHYLNVQDTTTVPLSSAGTSDLFVEQDGAILLTPVASQ
jgi:hypothetical protein